MAQNSSESYSGRSGIKFRLPRLGCFTLFLLVFFYVCISLVFLKRTAFPPRIDCKTPDEHITVYDPCHVLRDDDRDALTKLAGEVADAGDCDVALLFVNEEYASFQRLFDAVLRDWATPKGVLLMYGLNDTRLIMGLKGGEWRLAGHDEDSLRKSLSKHIYESRAGSAKILLDDLKRSARLCKCDLVTGMVTEFTELQGVMGREYARLDGEKADICEGIFEQYLPRFAGDILPKTETGQILSIADKVDNIVATFSRGKAPTGSQDPFALRRQALGIINILLDSRKHMDMAKLVGASILLLKVPVEKVKELAKQILDFIKLRFRNLLLEQKIRYDVIDAVLADERNNDLYDLYLRAQALNEYVNGAKAADMIQAATRVNNLSSKAETVVPVNASLFKEEAEKDLYAVVKKLDTEIIPLTVRYDYPGALNILSELNAPVNKFFDDVMVMDKDEAVKNNRLSLLCLVKDLVNCVGDLSKLVM